MNINERKNNNEIILELTGRLDTTTAPKLERVLQDFTDDIKSVILDLEHLEYLSSAGLRIILLMQKHMNKKGHMVVKNVNETIMEVFEITGFVDVLDIQ